jgi:hypothetical protein
MAATVIGDARRVEEHSPAAANERIRRGTERRLGAMASSPSRLERIEARLGALDREWDIERALEALSASLTLTGAAVSFAKNDRRWLILPLVVQGFFLQHAVQGRCPPLPLLRMLGFRTVREIERERRGLQALRRRVIESRLAPVE